MCSYYALILEKLWVIPYIHTDKAKVIKCRNATINWRAGHSQVRHSFKLCTSHTMYIYVFFKETKSDSHLALQLKVETQALHDSKRVTNHVRRTEQQTKTSFRASQAKSKCTWSQVCVHVCEITFTILTHAHLFLLETCSSPLLPYY